MFKRSVNQNAYFLYEEINQTFLSIFKPLANWLCVYKEINHVFEIAENSRFLNTMNLRVFSNTLMITHICVYCQSFFLMNETYCIIMTKIPNNNLIPCHHRSPLYFVPLSLSPLYLQLMSFCPLISLNFLFRCHCTAVLSSSFCLTCILWARTKT